MIYFLIGDLQTLDFLKLPAIDTSILIYLLIPFGAIVLGNVLYKKLLQAMDPQSNIERQFGTYQTACMVRWALLEGAALILLFVKPTLSLIGLLLIVYLLFLRPSEASMKKDIAVRLK